MATVMPCVWAGGRAALAEGGSNALRPRLNAAAKSAASASSRERVSVLPSGVNCPSEIIVGRARSNTIRAVVGLNRSEEHTSELQSIMRISYAVFCLKKQNRQDTLLQNHHHLI